MVLKTAGYRHYARGNIEQPTKYCNKKEADENRSGPCQGLTGRARSKFKARSYFMHAYLLRLCPVLVKMLFSWWQ